MNPEEKLLIELIKNSAGRKEYNRINWEKFTDLCYYHRITNFIYGRISKKNTPKKTIKRLKETCKKTLLKNMILNKEMISLSEELNKKKINFIALKGMALNHLLYSEKFSRVSSDIDLLIKEKDYEKIKRILENKGFKTSSFWLWEMKDYHHFPVIEKEINGINCMIELHKNLFFPANPFEISLNEIWLDSIKLNSVYAPSKEDLIILAVLSSVYQHAFYGLIEALIDTKKIIEKKINCKKLKEKTIKYKATEPMIYFNELFMEIYGKEIKGIKELEKLSDKKKLLFLRKHSLKKILQVQKGRIELKTAKNWFQWAENSKQEKKVISFIVNHKIFSSAWKIKNMWKNK